MTNPNIESLDGDRSQILTILLYQHHLLRKHLSRIKEKISADTVDGGGVVTLLRDFRVVLTDHFRLEDGEFYPQIIRNLEEKHIDTKSIKEFIEKMKGIGENVSHFLDSYDTVQKIEASHGQFKKEFSHMVSVLLMRNSTEEESVYLYWK